MADSPGPDPQARDVLDRKERHMDTSCLHICLPKDEGEDVDDVLPSSRAQG